MNVPSILKDLNIESRTDESLEKIRSAYIELRDGYSRLVSAIEEEQASRAK